VTDIIALHMCHALEAETPVCLGWPWGVQRRSHLPPARSICLGTLA